MKFYDAKYLLKTWSVRVWSLVPLLATIDYSTTWLDGVVDPQYKPVVYGILAAIGLFARGVQQPRLHEETTP